KRLSAARSRPVTSQTGWSSARRWRTTGTAGCGLACAGSATRGARVPSQSRKKRGWPGRGGVISGRYRDDGRNGGGLPVSAHLAGGGGPGSFQRLQEPVGPAVDVEASDGRLHPREALGARLGVERERLVER